MTTHRPVLASQLKTASSPLGRSPFAAPASIRLLTSEKREKVKVLQVLYDGGKHAEEVSFFPLHCPTLSPLFRLCSPLRHNNTLCSPTLPVLPPTLAVRKPLAHGGEPGR